MREEHRYRITSSMVELREQLSRMALVQPHQSGKSQLARELASQQSIYLNDRTREALGVEPPKKKKPPATRPISVVPSHQIPRSREPLPYSDLVDLLLRLEDLGLVRHYTLEWIGPDPTNLVDYGKIVVELQEDLLSEMKPRFLQWLLDRALGWTREVGGHVMMQFGVVRPRDLATFPPSNLRLGTEIAQKRAEFIDNWTLAFTPSVLGVDATLEPIEIEPSPDDPPGVQLGLVKRYLK